MINSIPYLFILVFINSAFLSLNAQNKDVGVGSSTTDNLTPVENRYAFLVGIDVYDDKDIKGLTSCRVDALQFEAFLRSPEGWQMPKDNLETLLSPKKKLIKDSFKNLLNKIQDPKNATFYFFYSGHGMPGKIIPADARQKDPSSFLAYSYFKDLLEEKNIKARVFIVDACYAGSINDTKSVKSEFNKQFISALQEDTSNNVQITFTAINEFQTAAAGANSSLFTKNIIEALESPKTDTNNDGIITSGELNQELLIRLKDSQKPDFIGVDSFPMASFKKNKPINLSLDTDGDGVFDTDDKCPEVFGITNNHGCPENNLKLDNYDILIPEEDLLKWVISYGKEKLIKDAESGIVGAQRRIGRVSEIYDDDPTQANYWYTKAYKSKDVHSTFKLGVSHFNGSGYIKSAYGALPYFKKAALAGNTDAMTYLGYIYEFAPNYAIQDKDNLHIDIDKAFLWYKHAADLDSRWAMRMLGMLYINKKIETENAEIEGRKWITKSCDKGNKKACKYLSTM